MVGSSVSVLVLMEPVAVTLVLVEGMATASVVVGSSYFTKSKSCLHNDCITITEESSLTWFRVLVGVASVVIGTVIIALVVGASVGNLFAVSRHYCCSLLIVQFKIASWNEVGKLGASAFICTATAQLLMQPLPGYLSPGRHVLRTCPVRRVLTNSETSINTPLSETCCLTLMH
jgi:hypothetical protein